MTEKKQKLTRAEAGRLGGLATRNKHGRDHFVNIGSLGGQETWNKHNLLPVGISGYAMVRKSDRKIVAIIGLRPRTAIRRDYYDHD